jgi:hypothetical protein
VQRRSTSRSSSPARSSSPPRSQRSCLAIELMPQYIDVAVERWQASTDETAGGGGPANEGDRRRTAPQGSATRTCGPWVNGSMVLRGNSNHLHPFEIAARSPLITGLRHRCSPIN